MPPIFDALYGPRSTLDRDSERPLSPDDLCGDDERPGDRGPSPSRPFVWDHKLEMFVEPCSMYCNEQCGCRVSPGGHGKKHPLPFREPTTGYRNAKRARGDDDRGNPVFVELRAENQMLRDTLDDYEAMIDSLKARADAAEALVKAARAAALLPPVDA